MNIIYSTSSLTLIILFLSLFGLIFSYLVYCYHLHTLIFFKMFLEKKSILFNKILALNLKFYYIFSSKWFFDKFYNIIVILTINFMYKIFMILDKGFFEFVGPYGITSVSSKLSNNLIQSNQGFLIQYLIFIYYGVFFIFFSTFLLILL